MHCRDREEKRDYAFDKQPGSTGVPPASFSTSTPARRQRSRQKSRRCIGLFVKDIILKRRQFSALFAFIRGKIKFA
jgi:hypothetical protein